MILWLKLFWHRIWCPGGGFLPLSCGCLECPDCHTTWKGKEH